MIDTAMNPRRRRRSRHEGWWTIASSEVSIDCGTIRLRCEGGSRPEKKTLMLFLKAVHDTILGKGETK